MILTLRRLALVALLALSALASGVPVPRSACFPIDRLPAGQRAESEALLLRLLDSEALYTVIGGLKPMSGGLPTLSISLDKPDLRKAQEIRELMSVWTCGDSLRFTLHHYARAFKSDKPGAAPQRFLSGVVFNLTSMAGVISLHQALFAPFGLTPNSDPVEILMAVEYLETAGRFRGYGFLFGYPDQAVEFFALNTNIPQTRNPDPNQPITPEAVKPSPRKFISIPTFLRETGSFVYAVDANHTEDDADRELLEKALPILQSYNRRRALYVGEGKPGAAALLRDWFCRGENNCSPSNATLDPTCVKNPQ